MNEPVPLVYRAVRTLIRAALGFYFQRMERFHADRIPASGAVLFTSNHPNSLTDSFVISASVPRPVHFVATVQLFRLAPLKWLLSRCGVIPINRVADDPKGMRSVAETFEACYRVLERGGAVGIFPEGITYEDDQLKEVKSGAARMALELEQRHGGRLGLQIVPAGLTYSAKERYRSRVLVHFGEPIAAAGFLQEYASHRKECIRKLTEEIEARLRSLIVDTPELEVERLVQGIKRLYLDRLRVGNRTVPEPTPPEARDLLLSRAIADAVRHAQRHQPERAAAFATTLTQYERWRDRLRLSESALAAGRNHGRLWLRTVLAALVALVGAPVALYGWVHRLLPWLLVRWAAARFVHPAKRKAQRSTAAIAAGALAFGIFYALCIAVCFAIFGWPVTLYYALSLPVASLLAHYYVVYLAELWQGVRDLLVLARAPFAARHLVAYRQALIEEIERFRQEYLAGTTKA